jgi:predicted alpha/beta-hydrolase family hydrolase
MSRAFPGSAESVVWQVPVGAEETSALSERAEAPSVDVVLVLGHGASSSREHAGMARLAATFLGRGLSVVRFNFLYTEKKKGPPDRMPRLMECFAAVVARARDELSPGHLVIGGHSMGGRTASMLAADGFACDGVLLLGYPLHPAGQPEKLRDAHLPKIGVPTLCLNGTRDDLCRRDLMETVLATLPATFTMHWIDAADHSFHVQKRSGRAEEEVQAEIGEQTFRWVESSILSGSRGRTEGNCEPDP